MMKATAISRQGGATKVTHYYAGGADDYYAKSGEAMSWHGQGAQRLGLVGAVDPQRFRDLLNGRIDDHTHLRRAANGDANRERLAVDLTFSAPKGVSLQALVGGDSRVIAAHDAAVAAAVREAETMAAARHTHAGKTGRELTGNLVVATFRHETSREQEPDLHTHAVVLNMTQRKDGQWRALTNDDLYRQQRHIDNVYKAELAKGLEAAGYTLRRDRDGNFDLAHLTREQIVAFSTRGQQIEDHLVQRGLTRESATAAQKQAAAMQTRKPKQQIDRDDLWKQWSGRAVTLGVDFTRRDWAGAGAQPNERGAAPTAPLEAVRPTADLADESVRFAIHHLTERQAIVRRSELTAEALKHGTGKIALADVRGALARAEARGHLLPGERQYAPAKSEQKPPPALTAAGWTQQLIAAGATHDQARDLVATGIRTGRLVATEPRYTTQEAVQREMSVLRMERVGRGAFVPLVAAPAATEALQVRPLSNEQVRAAALIASTSDRFIGVQGFAGTGKTHMLDAAKQLIEAHEGNVIALAPYAGQRKTLQEYGFESRTIAAFLKASDRHIDSRSVVFVDEAGLVPARQMQQLMQVVEQAGARAVLVGDTAQTKAIEAGRPFAQLMHSGMSTASLVDIRRQQNPELLEAVKLAAEGRAAESLQRVTRVHVIAPSEDRHAAVARAFAALEPGARDATLVITGTNASRKAITAEIRHELGLQGTGHPFKLLSRVDTTQAERRDSRNYKVDQVIVPERDYAAGLQRGQQYTVLDTGPGNRLTVVDDAGQQVQFCPARCRQLSVYELDTAEVAAGDRLRVTRNDARADLANRDLYTVQQVYPKHIEAKNAQGRSVIFDLSRPAFLDHAYCSTVHSAQGLTADRALLNLDAASRTTTKDVYYTALSRARHEVAIYTDDKAKLPDAISREADKTAALDLERRERRPREHDATPHERQRHREDDDRMRQLAR